MDDDIPPPFQLPNIIPLPDEFPPLEHGPVTAEVRGERCDPEG